MAQQHYLIIGNGTAGNRAADTLRQGDADAKITIVSAEPVHYLKRHKLAKFLVEDTPLDSLDINKPEWYTERKIALRLNQPVVKVDPIEKTVLLAHRELVKYDKLLICSGARHRVPEYLLRFEKLLTNFSTGVDAVRLKSKLGKIKHLTLLGGDCIGLILIAALLPIGKKITMLLDEHRFWPLEFDDSVKDRLAAAIAKKGVEVVAGDYVTEIAQSGARISIKTRNGKNIETDAAVPSSGMVPDLAYLSDSTIDAQDGLLVNERLETSVKDVWAAGECAQIYHPQIKDYRCSTGYANASEQGVIAAKNMLGGSEPATLCEPGRVVIGGEEFITYGWKGFSLDEAG